MAQCRCKSGHLYDSDIYGNVCPYCTHSGNTIDFDADIFDSSNEYNFKTVAQHRISPQEEMQKTRAPQSYIVKQEEEKKTVAVYSKLSGKDPVVAWLVCASGSEEGKDYRLTAKTNTIGRGTDNDVCIKGDDTITKDTHAKIDYDILNNRFYLIPGNNKNTIYINSIPVYVPQLLNDYDVLRIGSSDMIFVPFCCEKFTWQKK